MAVLTLAAELLYLVLYRDCPPPGSPELGCSISSRPDGMYKICPDAPELDCKSKLGLYKFPDIR